MQYSFISILVSDAGFDSWKEQIEDAIRFLEKNKSSMNLIPETPEIDQATLDFEIRGRDKFCQSVILPNKLLKLAADSGIEIEISIYGATADE